jgi:hypothetical protein
METKRSTTMMQTMQAVCTHGTSGSAANGQATPTVLDLRAIEKDQACRK